MSETQGTPAVERFLAEHAAVASGLPGSGTPWLDATRSSALERFADIGFPTRRNEQWKYTRVTPIEGGDFRIAGGSRLDESAIEPFLFPQLDCHRMVFVDGRFEPVLSRLDGVADSLRIDSLAEALAREPESLEPYLGGAGEAEHGFAALNRAFMGDGAVIRLPKGELGTPIHLIFISGAGEGESASHPCNLILAASGSRATVIESYVGIGETHYLTNCATKVVLEANAELEHITVQQEGSGGYHIADLRVEQERDSRFTSNAVAFGGRLARTGIHATLGAEGCECALNGLYMGDNRQHIDFHTTVEHAAPHGASREFYKGILGGNARGVFNGRVHVHPHAQKTDSQQSNQNLLLSRNAEVDTKPELEIYADDVKCSHGATVGQLDAEMLFYLRSRGIDKEAAQGLLTYGFAKEIIQQITLEPVRERLEQLLLSRVPDAEHVKGML